MHAHGIMKKIVRWKVITKQAEKTHGKVRIMRG